MSIYPHYQPYVRHLYMYLMFRVQKDLDVFNAERQLDNAPPLELNEEQLDQVVTSLLNYIHDTDEFYNQVKHDILEVVEDEANG